MRHEFIITSFNISEKTGTRKTPVEEVMFIAAFGIEHDAHGGKMEDRQVSLLSMDDVECSAAYERALKKDYQLKAGDFAENITTRGVAWHTLPLGTKIFIGEPELELSKIGKSCHSGCEISKITGECIMPVKGVFARVLKGGRATLESNCYYTL